MEAQVDQKVSFSPVWKPCTNVSLKFNETTNVDN